MKIYFCDNLAESQVEDSLNVIFVATFSFMIFYSFFYDLLVEIVFLWSLWFFGCPKCGNDFYDFLLQSLVILMIFMILMILNFLFISHPPFPTASSFGTLVGGAHLMMSYLNKHFEPIPILCAVDFCLESRPVNPIVYLVKKKWEWNTKILIIFVLSIQNVQYVTVRIPSCRWFESVMMFL